MQLTKHGGFTLIELVMVIVILGILAALAIPKFVDLTSEAKINATKSGLGAIRSVIGIQYAQSATSGTASFPFAITTDLFADGRIPENKLNNSTSVRNIRTASRERLPLASQVSIDETGITTSTYGWWYISTSGKVGAYSDGTVDTSDW